MALLTHELKTSSEGDGKWAGSEDGQELIDFAPCDTAACDSSKFTIATRGYAVPKVKGRWHPSSFSRHTVTTVISLPSIGLACPMHRLHLKLVSDFRWPGMPLHFLWIQLEQPPQKMEFVPMPLRPTPQGSLPDFWSTSSPGPDNRTLVLPMLNRSPFPSRGSASIVVPPESQWWWPGLLHTGFRRDIMYETHGRGLPEPWWTVRGSTALANAHFHTEICFWHFHTCSVWAAPLVKLAKSPPDDTSGYTIECLFQINKGHVQCLSDGIKLLL